MDERRNRLGPVDHQPWLTLRVETTEIQDRYDVGPYARVDAWLVEDGVPVARALLPTPFASLPGRHLLDALAPDAAYGRLVLALAPAPEQRRSAVLPVTVVVTAGSRPDALDRCLQSVAALAPAVSEVLVADTGLVGAAGRRAAESAGVRHVAVPSGAAAARTAAVAAARHDLVLLVDEDVEVDPRWAGSMVAAFDDPLVAAATAVVLRAVVEPGADQLSERRALHRRPWWPRTYDGSSLHPFHAAQLGSWASMAVRRHEFLALGGFPARLDSAGADTALLHAALLAGYRVAAVPSSVGWRAPNPAALSPERVVWEQSLAAGGYLLEAVRLERRPGSALIGARQLLGGVARRTGSRLLARETAPAWSLVRAELAGLGAAPVARRRGHAADQGQRARPGGDSPWLDRLLARRPVAAVSTRELPALSVVVPTRGRREKVVRLVRSLQAQRYDDARLEIVIAVDGDVDGTAQALAALDVPRPPHVLVLHSPGDDPHHGSGAGTARNAGAREATGDVLLFLDDDVEPVDDQLLLAHAAGREQHVDALLVGLCPPRMAEQSSYLSQAARAWWAEQTSALLTGQHLRFTDVTTANLSVPRQAFLEHDGFMAIPRREDWELGLRLGLAGMAAVALPAAAVEHLYDTEPAGFLADVRREGAGDAEMVQRHPSALGMLQLESWRSARSRRRRALTAFVEQRTSPALVPVAGAAYLSLLERAGLRGRWQRALGQLIAVAYWNGVGDALGSVRRLEELLTTADALAEQRCGSFDGVTGELRLPAPGEASEVDVLADGRHLGRLPLRWGGVPFRPDAFVERAVAVYAAPLLAARVGGSR